MADVLPRLIQQNRLCIAIFGIRHAYTPVIAVCLDGGQEYLVIGIGPIKSASASASRTTIRASGALNMSRLEIHTDAGDAVDIPAILSFALNKVTESIFLIDASSRIRYVNQECCRTLGYSQQDLLAMRVADIDPTVDQTVWRDHWQALTAEISLTFESRHLTRQGKLLPVEINANYFEYAGTAYNLALVRDISTRKNLQDQLEASEAKFRDLVEHAPDIFIRYDRECRRIFISQAYEEVYGIPLTQALGKKPTEVWGKAWMTPAEYERQLQEIMRSRKPGNIELQWVADDGQYVCKSLQIVV